MKKLLTAVGAAVVLSVAMVSPALAWHPEVKIVKKVQNVTAGSEVSDANTDQTAVAVKPGDVIKYVIEVSNPAKPASKSYNDLYYTELTDNLPAGVELVNDPAKRKIVENLGVLKPGDKVVKEYQLKVVSNTNDQLIVNEACVKGDSKVKDAPRKDCDKAKIKVSVPPKEQPKEEPKKEVLPAKLPETGGAAVAGVLGIGAASYSALMYLRSRKAYKQ